MLRFAQSLRRTAQFNGSPRTALSEKSVSDLCPTRYNCELPSRGVTLIYLIVEAAPNSADPLRAEIELARPVCITHVAPLDTADDTINTSNPDAIFVATHGDVGSASQFVRNLRARGSTLPAIVVMDQGTPQLVRDVLRSGAQDVLFWREVVPGSLAPIMSALQRRLRLSEDIRRAEGVAEGTAGLVGHSEAMEKVRRMVSLVAVSDSPVLVVGETGVGKGLVARAIHEAGPRRHLLFRSVNCAATPSSLMESVMYGHERGSFTGAFKRQRGQFEVVGAGTLLLDEVAEVPIELQTKLLHSVEERFFQRIGAENEVAFAGRIIASTNADLSERMATGRFRPDLYYRLSVLRLRVPPLAERTDDIPELLELFTRSAQHPIRLTPDAVGWMVDRPWPGNVRELRNAVHRLSVLFPGREVGLPDVKEYIDDPAREEAEIERAAQILGALPGGFKAKVATLEALIVRNALRNADGNRSAAARALGVDRRVIERVEASMREHCKAPE